MSSEANTPAVRVEGVGKYYPRPSPHRIVQLLSPFPPRFRPGDFRALADVSFDVARGEVLGIVGRNGSGKSTLMQMIAGLMLPSEGSITVNGRSAALLELGAGFNPEFTGRENVMLSGMLYGFSRADMATRYDRIAAFADIGEHVDKPVKTYSSGMFARLAFAVSIHVDPDILLVDEILSVGDVGFRSRCHRRLEDMRAAGTSVLFVTHDMATVQTLCDRVLLLDRGRMIMVDTPRLVTDRYLALLSDGQEGGADASAAPDAETGPAARWRDVRFENEAGVATTHPRVGDRCRVTARVCFLVPVENPVISLQLKTMTGFVVYDQNTMMLEQRLAPCRAGDERQVECTFVLNVCPGPFRIGLGLADEINGVPRAVGGCEMIAFEAISDRRAYGLANLDAGIRVTP